MIRKGTICILILSILVCGCATTQDNKNLNFNNPSSPKMNEPAIFETDGNSIVATLDQVDVNQRESYIYDITFHMTAKNNGKKAINLIVLGSTLTDYAGVSQTGSTGYFGLLYPDESGTSDITFTISSTKFYQALLKGATLDVTFMGDKQIKHDAYWNIDFNNIKIITTTPPTPSPRKINLFEQKTGWD
jgi:hypothetical protein